MLYKVCKGSPEPTFMDKSKRTIEISKIKRDFPNIPNLPDKPLHLAEKKFLTLKILILSKGYFSYPKH